MGKLYRLILGENCTISNGTVLKLVEEGHELRNGTSKEDEYDAVGAMEFIVATILVYSIFGVFCTLITKIKRSRGRSHMNSLIDESVTKYLKRENSLKFDGQRSTMKVARERIVQQMQEFEQKQALLDNDREVSSEVASSPGPAKKKRKKKKGRKRRRETGIEDFTEHLETEFLAPDVDIIVGTSEGPAGASLADTLGEELCESLESLTKVDKESDRLSKVIVTDV